MRRRDHGHKPEPAPGGAAELPTCLALPYIEGAEAGMPNRPQRPQVLIVGAGFGGLEATKALARADVDVTLVDAYNHHCF